MAEPNAEWMAVLAQIERSVEQSLLRTPEPPPSAPKTEASAPLAQLDDRLARWQACLERAEAGAREAEKLLATEQAAAAECCRQLAEIRGKLAGWAERAIPG